MTLPFGIQLEYRKPEGYQFYVRTGRFESRIHRVEAIESQTGARVGVYEFVEQLTEPHARRLFPLNVKTHQDVRGKGLATAAYLYIGEILGKVVERPSTKEQSKDAQRFWNHFSKLDQLSLHRPKRAKTG